MLIWLLPACTGQEMNRETPPVETATNLPKEETPDQQAVLAPTGKSPTPSRPAVSSELHATDPQAVTLASGKVQLVEFFAFW
jgi:hypothetical protein